MRKQIALGVVTALGFAGSAFAEGFSYSTVEETYSSIKLKGTTAKADGFGVSGSYGFNEHFSVFAGYNDLAVNHGGGSVKFLSLGLGLNWGLADNLDLTSGLS